MSSTIVAKLIVAASLVVSPVAASATETAAATQSAASAPAAKPAEEKKICKQLPSSTSRLPQRACLTAAQWKQVDEDK